MHTFHQLSLYSHIIIGCFALIVFWIAAATRKGSKNHKRVGRMFTWSMTLTSWTGMLLSGLVILFPVAIRFANGVPENINLEQKVIQIQTISGFLFYLSLLVWANTRHATKVLEAKDDRTKLRTPMHVGLLASLPIFAIPLAYASYVSHIKLLVIFAVIGAMSGITSLRYVYAKAMPAKQWLIQHISSILGAGIGVHTATFAFGGRKLFSGVFTGDLIIIPWIVPNVVGTIAIIALTRIYTKKWRISKDNLVTLESNNIENPVKAS